VNFAPASIAWRDDMPACRLYVTRNEKTRERTMNPLVTTEWLAGELGKTDIRVIDATLFLSGHNRNARSEFEAAHIPGAVFFDIDEVSDHSSSLPHMLPPAEKFASRMQALGLGDGSRIIVYDNSPLRSAARVWWMLTLFGAHEIAILDGGFAKWLAEGRGTESGKPIVRHRHFTVWADTGLVRDQAQMVDNLRSKAAQVVDARSPGRFAGSEPEPRPGLRAGHLQDAQYAIPAIEGLGALYGYANNRQQRKAGNHTRQVRCPTRTSNNYFKPPSLGGFGIRHHALRSAVGRYDL